MSDIKRLYPDVRVLVGNSIYVKASVVTTSGTEHEIKVQMPAKQHQAAPPLPVLSGYVAVIPFFWLTLFLSAQAAIWWTQRRLALKLCSLPTWCPSRTR